MKAFSRVLIAAGLVTATIGGGMGLAAWVGQRVWQEEARTGWTAELLHAGVAEGRQELTRLTFPAQGAEFIVWEGASKKNLLYGPARVEGSAIPGGNGNCIIAAHRDTHFRMLRDVRKDQEILLTRDGRVYRYRITGLHIVKAADTRYYGPAATPTLTLVTCYPFSFLGHAPKRYIVQAQLLEPPQSGSPQAFSEPEARSSQ